MFATHCKFDNKHFILINVHFPSYKQTTNVDELVQVIMKIIESTTFPNIIVASDMNIDKYVLSSIKQIRSIILRDFKKTHTTSFKLGICENNEFTLLSRQTAHKFLDDIYVSSTVEPFKYEIVSTFDEKYKIIDEETIENPLYKFVNIGDPYCDPSIFSESGQCMIYNTSTSYSDAFEKSTITYNKQLNQVIKSHQLQQLKPWPSDHVLLYPFQLILEFFYILFLIYKFRHGFNIIILIWH